MTVIVTGNVPTLAHVLQTLAYQCSLIMSDRPRNGVHDTATVNRFGLACGGFGDGCPEVHANITIEPSMHAVGETDPIFVDPEEQRRWADRWGVWAQVYIAQVGTDESSWCTSRGGIARVGRWHGNRCGGRDAWAAMCAPVIEWVVDYWSRVT